MGLSAILLVFIGISVESVTDGDSFRIKTAEGFELRARLIGVDCPELGRDTPQPGALEAKKALEAYLAQKHRIQPLGTDRYNRSLVEVYLQDGGMINLRLIEEGYCEAYRGKIQSQADLYRAAEKKAKAAKKGIWGMKNYESPYLFRKRQMR